jgi:hypothetical protein
MNDQDIVTLSEIKTPAHLEDYTRRFGLQHAAELLKTWAEVGGSAPEFCGGIPSYEMCRAVSNVVTGTPEVGYERSTYGQELYSYMYGYSYNQPGRKLPPEPVKEKTRRVSKPRIKELPLCMCGCGKRVPSANSTYLDAHVPSRLRDVQKRKVPKATRRAKPLDPQQKLRRWSTPKIFKNAVRMGILIETTKEDSACPCYDLYLPGLQIARIHVEHETPEKREHPYRDRFAVEKKWAGADNFALHGETDFAYGAMEVMRELERNYFNERSLESNSIEDVLEVIHSVFNSKPAAAQTLGDSYGLLYKFKESPEYTALLDALHKYTATEQRKREKLWAELLLE